MTARRIWAATVVGLLGLALLAVPLSFQSTSPSPPRNVDVLFLDTVTFSVLRHSYPDPDLMNALVLAIGCGVALMAALVVWNGLGPFGLRWFFLVSAILLAVLAIEETFELSEAVAAGAGMNPRRTDLLLPVVGVAFVLGYRRLLLRSRRAAWIGAAGALIFALALLSDTLVGVSRTEDPLESVASLLLMTAFAVLTLDLLSARAPAETTA